MIEIAFKFGVLDAKGTKPHDFVEQFEASYNIPKMVSIGVADSYGFRTEWYYTSKYGYSIKINEYEFVAIKKVPKKSELSFH